MKYISSIIMLVTILLTGVVHAQTETESVYDYNFEFTSLQTGFNGEKYHPLGKEISIKWDIPEGIKDTPTFFEFSIAKVPYSKIDSLDNGGQNDYKVYVDEGSVDMVIPNEYSVGDPVVITIGFGNSISPDRSGALAPWKGRAPMPSYLVQNSRLQEPANFEYDIHLIDTYGERIEHNIQRGFSGNLVWNVPKDIVWTNEDKIQYSYQIRRSDGSYSGVKLGEVPFKNGSAPFLLRDDVSEGDKIDIDILDASRTLAFSAPEYTMNERLTFSVHCALKFSSPVPKGDDVWVFVQPGETTDFIWSTNCKYADSVRVSLSQPTKSDDLLLVDYGLVTGNTATIEVPENLQLEDNTQLFVFFDTEKSRESFPILFVNYSATSSSSGSKSIELNPEAVGQDRRIFEKENRLSVVTEPVPLLEHDQFVAESLIVFPLNLNYKTGLPTSSAISQKNEVVSFLDLIYSFCSSVWISVVE